MRQLHPARIDPAFDLEAVAFLELACGFRSAHAPIAGRPLGLIQIEIARLTEQFFGLGDIAPVITALLADGRGQLVRLAQGLRSGTRGRTRRLNEYGSPPPRG